MSFGNPLLRLVRVRMFLPFKIRLHVSESQRRFGQHRNFVRPFAGGTSNTNVVSPCPLSTTNVGTNRSQRLVFFRHLARGFLCLLRLFNGHFKERSFVIAFVFPNSFRPFLRLTQLGGFDWFVAAKGNSRLSKFVL